MVWSDWWGFWAFGLDDSGTPCGIRFALPRPPRFARDLCKTSRTSLYCAANLAREAQRNRDSRFPTRQTRSKPPLIPP